MSKFTSSMFETLKESLTKKGESGSNLYKNILKTEPGNTYVVRLVPNMQDAKKTFFHHIQHGWTSFATGQYVSALSPSTWGEVDPIGQTRYKLIYKSNNDADKVKGSEIKRSEKWLANVYVVEDPVNKSNNGTVKILRFGKQLHKIIMDAMSGEESEEFGDRIFDLSERGCNLKIKVEKQGDFPFYGSSRFTAPKELADMDSKSQEKVYESVFDLEAVYTKKSQEELLKMLQEHFFCNVSVSATPSSSKTKAAVEKTEDIVEQKVVLVSNPPLKKPEQSEEALIKNLLEGLETE